MITIILLLWYVVMGVATYFDGTRRIEEYKALGNEINNEDLFLLGAFTVLWPLYYLTILYLYVKYSIIGVKKDD